jgi:hypothetical protein
MTAASAGDASTGLRVIGAGWGRTGTESLKAALEMLGFGRCYHAFEMMARMRHVRHWKALARGEQPDYDDLFRGFQSAVDFPVARFYRELAARYPEAKVVLSVRDPGEWYESASKTILRGIPGPMRFVFSSVGRFSPNLRHGPELLDFMEETLFRGFFEDRYRDRDHMIARFIAWNEEVQRTLPKERLLVYEVKQGWEPLCNFLGVPVPSRPFPRNNDSAAFEHRNSPGNILREFWAGADP